MNRALFYGGGMKSIKFLLFSVLALMLSGCAGYHVGSTLDKSIKTVSLEIINKSGEPSIEVAVEKALRAELQMDGRLEVRPKEVADAVLSVTLTGFDLDPLSYVRNLGAMVAEYRITLTARAVLSDAETGKVILETPVVQGFSDFPYTADLTSTKRAGTPKAANDLANKVVSATVTAW